MQWIGKVLHVTPFKHAITRIRPTKGRLPVEVNMYVIDDDFRPVGKIDNIFGPIEHPYISVRLDIKMRDPGKLVGRNLYALSEKEYEQIMSRVRL